MGVATRDGYSGFSFYNAYPADVISGAAGSNNGRTIDLRGFGTATVVVNAHSVASGGAAAAADFFQLKLQHGLASANGVSAWSNVPHSQLIHSVIGLNGAYSILSDGIFQSISSSTDAVSTQVYAVGYVTDGKHRYLRLVISNIDAMSAMWAAAIAILGEPDTWPVNAVARAT